MKRIPFIIALLMACSAEDGSTDPIDPAANEPCFEVDSDPVRFGPVPLAGPAGEAVIVLRNACGGELRLDEATFEQDRDAFGVVDADLRVLGAGEEVRWNLAFAPDSPGRVDARLTIPSNAGRRVIALQGTGRGGQVVSEPVVLDFGELEVGCVQERTLGLRNAGNEPMALTELGLTGSPDATLVAVPDLPMLLAPDQTAPVVLQYQAPALAPLTATLSVRSDDPVRPLMEVEIRGMGITGPTQTEVFDKATSPRTDVVFTVDRSGRMPERLPGLLDAVPAMFSGLREQGPDVHLTVIVADDGCPVARPGFIDDLSDVDAASRNFVALTDPDFSRAKAGLDEERGFLLADRALDQTGEGACLEGFRRVDASLATVHISDEDEQSGMGWEGQINALSERTAGSGRYSVHAIAGDFPSGCRVAVSGDEYWKAAYATGGTFHSVCADDHVPAFEDLAVALSSPRLSFQLAHPPMPETLRLAVDGDPWATGWSYNAETQSVRLDPATAPSSAAELTITYVERLECR